MIQIRSCTVMLLLIFVSGCCNLREGQKVVDRIEHYVLSGSGEPPACKCKACCVLPASNSLILAKKSANATLWYRVVLFDALNKGVEGIPIAVDLVSSQGGMLVKDVYNILGKNASISGSKGFGKFEFVVPGELPSTARVRIRYIDGAVETYSYGPHIYVQSP